MTTERKIPEGKRNRSIDVSKGIAAIMVVTGHLINYDLSHLPSPYFFRNFLYMVHMPLFCLINGWLSVQMMKAGFAQVIKKAFMRLLVPYTLWSSAAVAAKVFMGCIRGSLSVYESYRLWIQTILMGTSMWFFLALTMIWIVSWIVYHLEKRCWPLMLIALVIIMLVPFPYESEVYALHRLHDLLPLHYLAFFARRIDMQTQMITNWVKSRSALIGCIILILFTPWQMNLYDRISGIRIYVPLVVILELTMVGAVFIPCGRFVHRLRGLEMKLSAMGFYSMDIYCIHMLFVEYLHYQMPIGIINGRQCVSALAYLTEGILIATVSTIIAILLRRFIPFYRWMMSGQWPAIRQHEKEE